MNFKEELDKRAAYAEEILRRYLPEPGGPYSKITEAVRYCALGEGKRLRPILMLEAYRLYGGRDEKLIEPFMAAIEMIHNYSLVHDDLPAMDDDDYRRGRPTAHIAYGEAFAILAGDALLNLAAETACLAFEACPARSAVIGKALLILFGKAGIGGMIGGQAADISFSGISAGADEIIFIYAHKTAALIEAAMMTGACLAGASEDEIRAAEEAARKIGIAFQIRDDMLDVAGDAAIMGKPIHSDERNKKPTYAALFGMEKSKETVQEYLREAALILKKQCEEDGFLENLLKSLAERQK